MVQPASINFILNDVTNTRGAFPVRLVQVEAPRSNQHGEARTEIPYMEAESGTIVDLDVLAIAALYVRNGAGQSFPEQLPRVWTTVDEKAERAPAGGATHQLKEFQPPSWSIAFSLIAGGNGCSWPTATAEAHAMARKPVGAMMFGSAAQSDRSQSSSSTDGSFDLFEDSSNVSPFEGSMISDSGSREMNSLWSSIDELSWETTSATSDDSAEDRYDSGSASDGDDVGSSTENNHSQNTTEYNRERELWLVAGPGRRFSLPTCVPALLFSGYPPFSVTDVNDLWLQLCGFSRHEVIGQTMRIIQGPETERDLVDGLMTHVRRRQPFNTVLTNYTKTRQAFRNELRVEPVDAWNGLRGPFVLACSRMSLLTQIVTISCSAAQPQSTISVAAGNSMPILVPQKSTPLKLNVQMPSTLASPFFQPKMIEQKELNNVVRLAAVERYGSYWHSVVLGWLADAQIDPSFFCRPAVGSKASARGWPNVGRKKSAEDGARGRQ